MEQGKTFRTEKVLTLAGDLQEGQRGGGGERTRIPLSSQERLRLGSLSPRRLRLAKNTDPHCRTRACFGEARTASSKPPSRSESVKELEQVEARRDAACNQPQPKEPLQCRSTRDAGSSPATRLRSRRRRGRRAPPSWPASLGALFTTLWSLAPAPPLPSHCLEEQPRPQRLLFISPQCPDVNGLQCIFQGNLLLSM
ncbi:hypothetical protein GHT09_007999 [Marmota monax]|uniref:Uncharacterized protein n=1 Tax=Marmota monax TaxID=9995 RepID=A0A834PR12_MARMO|nr:hypothetical protein GHT09_007999 [Marmota monax]